MTQQIISCRFERRPCEVDKQTICVYRKQELQDTAKIREFGVKGMGVRSTVKAIIVHEGRVLLNRCHDAINGDYYSLPGGGQEQNETLYEALVRECLEETGYTVEPQRFSALMEEICLDPYIIEHYNEYVHKMLHLFVCALADVPKAAPTETDDAQVACEWVPAENVKNVNLLPKEVRAHFDELLERDCPQFLGSVHLEHNHG